ncbi:STM4504/CBY_0614 family protein [Pseudoalteromonas sp. S2755]|uniref:STM4504/CBY_0614 family protein n=1 Tax=Pseudoalteromonas sp. S2755 TaxID=2066523 RepID=UPI00110BCDD2|nr:hypothetical protein [Pseudoalteromonas sp. S2755]TMN44834.1 hypothetical protein CWC03_03055 [Pseudoalteromonas sp. S2755]
MSMFELYSAKQKRLNGEVPDVYQYDELSSKLKNQIVHILEDTIGSGNAVDFANNLSAEIYQQIHKILCKELGVRSLGYGNSYKNIVFEYFLREDLEVEECLDIVDLFFHVVDNVVRKNERSLMNHEGTSQSADDAIDELNERFKVAGVGYQFAGGEIIRVDSEFIHSEVVQPALIILQEFDGARLEFLSAHNHYRHQRYSEALVDCNKSFESLMKAICSLHEWDFKPTDTSKKLINICLSNNLIPSYMQAQFNHFQGLLESGVPTIRNKEGSHGKGNEISTVSIELVSYTLHLTAANLVFLGECSKKLSK